MKRAISKSLPAVLLLIMGCANERPQRAADMDPSSPDAPAGQVVVPTAFKPAPEENTAPVADEGAHKGHGQGAMTQATADAASGGHGQHMADATATGKGEAGPMYTCPMHPEVRQSTPGKCPKCGMKLVREAADAGAAAAVRESATPKTTEKKKTAQIYTCPMHPDVEKSGPGECPKCGMKLVPKAQPKAKTDTGKTATPDAQGEHEGH